MQQRGVQVDVRLKAHLTWCSEGGEVAVSANVQEWCEASPAAVSKRMMKLALVGFGPTDSTSSKARASRPLPTQPRPKLMVFLLAKRATIWYEALKAMPCMRPRTMTEPSSHLHQ